MSKQKPNTNPSAPSTAKQRTSQSAMPQPTAPLDTKHRILDVALSLFAQKGYANVFVGEIAEKVGIKAPSLYKHFKSKQAIFEGVLECQFHVCVLITQRGGRAAYIEPTDNDGALIDVWASNLGGSEQYNA